MEGRDLCAVQRNSSRNFLLAIGKVYHSQCDADSKHFTLTPITIHVAGQCLISTGHYKRVYDTKVLYPFTRPLVERSSDDFKRFALEDSPQDDCFDHYGMSVISELYDHDLPSAIMIDYLHTSLLRQTKTIITHLRELLSISELERLDKLLKHQLFLHTFNRRLPSCLNLAYVKGSELRNLLLYAMIPRLIDFFEIELVSFLYLFVCGVRLLHGSPGVAVDQCVRQQLSSQLFDNYQ
ncbi:unnamed protein product, partial [Didymodactylos carnosus]